MAMECVAKIDASPRRDRPGGTEAVELGRPMLATGDDNLRLDGKRSVGVWLVVARGLSFKSHSPIVIDLVLGEWL